MAGRFWLRNFEGTAAHFVLAVEVGIVLVGRRVAAFSAFLPSDGEDVGAGGEEGF